MARPRQQPGAAAPHPQNAALQQHAAQHQQKQQHALDTLGQMGVDQSTLDQLGIKHPAKALHQLQTGKGPAFKQMNLLALLNPRYQKAQGTLTTGLTDPSSPASMQAAENDLNAQVDLRKQEDPMIGQMQDYLSSRLGVGLTPEEESAMRGELRAPVEQAYNQAVTSAGQGEAAAGIAPGSGASVARGQQAEQARQQGLSNVENQIVQENLQRKQQIEQEAATQASLEEQARGTDITAQQAQQALQLRQLGLAEAGLSGLSNLSEGQREFDVTETEAKRQAWLARQMWQKYAASMQPSTLESVAGGVSGFLGGLTGGGGGGGMMGMG
jgi:hypothetical protein